MRALLFGLLVLGLATNLKIGVACGQEEQGAKERARERSTDDQNEPSETRAYLGVAVEPLHPSLFGHLADLLHGGEGVRVVAVGEGSPAEEAGLKPNDILLRYDDQRVFTPEQLAKLVRLDKPGHEITLTVIRSGKTRKLTTVLGERSEPPAPPAYRALRPRTNGRQPRSEGTKPNGVKPDQWESFDSLTLSRVDNEHFRATIKYRNEDGKVVTHRFKGTREEIRQDIEEERDLPANERTHLLRALGLEGRPVPLALPELWVLPDGRVILEMPEPEGELETEDLESGF
ncbi:MAG TPA: PDZ domain-containing protein [Pirellulales bacterium]|nr:PDZ domain-containing protein [Pirellulales bacterium]